MVYHELMALLRCRKFIVIKDSEIKVEAVLLFWIVKLFRKLTVVITKLFNAFDTFSTHSGVFVTELWPCSQYRVIEQVILVLKA